MKTRIVLAFLGCLCLAGCLPGDESLGMDDNGNIHMTQGAAQLAWDVMNGCEKLHPGVTAQACAIAFKDTVEESSDFRLHPTRGLNSSSAKGAF